MTSLVKGTSQVEHDLHVLYARLKMAEAAIAAIPDPRYELGWWGDVDGNVPISQTNVALPLFGSASGLGSPAFNEVPLIHAGTVTGIVVRLTAARTNGTLTVELTKNGSGAGLTAVIDGSSTQQTIGTGSVSFVAGDRLGVRITTDGSWSPTVNNVITALEVTPA